MDDKWHEEHERYLWGEPSTSAKPKYEEVPQQECGEALPKHDQCLEEMHTTGPLRFLTDFAKQLFRLFR